MSTQVRLLTRSETAKLRAQAKEYKAIRVGILAILGAVCATIAWVTGSSVVLSLGILLAVLTLLYLVIVFPDVSHRFDWREMEDWYQEILWGKGQQPR